MEVRIENPVNDLDLASEIMLIIDKAIESTSIDNLINEIELLEFVRHINTRLISYGRGGNHVWVSIKNKRILLITK